MCALRAARAVAAPDWLIAAGAVGTAVWDHLHGFAPPTASTADRLTVVAPYGVDDLLGLVHRHIPRRVSAGLYEQRRAAKRIRERWPRVTVLPAARP
jgi:hypothetical protein